MPSADGRGVRQSAPAISACLFAFALACGSQLPAGVAPENGSDPSNALADLTTEIVTEALRADARGEGADTLYTSSALIVADGQRRTGPPRFAGTGRDGQVAVTSSQVEISRTVAWVYAEYRWFSTRNNQAREGRVTMILSSESSGGRWRITHAHSSSVR